MACISIVWYKMTAIQGTSLGPVKWTQNSGHGSNLPEIANTIVQRYVKVSRAMAEKQVWSLE